MITLRLRRDLSVGFAVGAFSGMLGVGGGILLVPYLVLRRHLSQKRAQATSLVMVAAGAAAGASTYALRGQVAWTTAGIVLPGALAGAWIGSHLVRRTPDRRLRIGFGLLLLFVAVRMAWPMGGASPSDQSADISLLMVAGLVVSGIAMGSMSALFGIGGGIVLIPILVTAFAFPQHLAAGTALAVMGPIAAFGAWRLARDQWTEWALGLRIGAGSVFGAVAGSALALAAADVVVRVIFAAILATVGIQLMVTARLARASAPELQ